MVQLPEPCAKDSEAFKAGYKNICEIGKERIRRAGEKIKAENPLTTQDLDLLFGCLIDRGLPLSMPYKSEKLDGCTVHTYNDGDLIACFDEDILESVVKEIAKRISVI